MMKLKVMAWFVCAINIYSISFGVFADEHNVNFSLKQQASETSPTLLHNQPQKNTRQSRQIKQDPGSVKRPGSWSEKFRPSENIDADSVISFPVDI